MNSFIIFDHKNSLRSNRSMSDIPRMKKFDIKKQFSVKIDSEVEEIYKMGRQNGWDVSEIARRALSDIFKKLAADLKRPAS